LDTRNLGLAVARALLERKARPLGKLPQFRGAGIYALYYHGQFPCYAPIAGANEIRDRPRWPIYIGKAIPEGARKGVVGTTDTNRLFQRLGKHAASITEVENLCLRDFSCRFLVVQDLWIPLAEQLLISHFAPIWNRLIDGFGNNDPGAGRYNGMRPRWDVLHPGREWADKCAPRPESSADIRREVEHHLRSAAIPTLTTMDGDLNGE